MVTVQELLSLWHSDRDTIGYAHPEIVAAVCKLKRPPNAQAVRLIFYRADQLGDVPEDLLIILDDGYHVWRERERQRCPA